MDNKLFTKLLGVLDFDTITQDEATKILEHVIELENEIEELNQTIDELSER